MGKSCCRGSGKEVNRHNQGIAGHAPLPAEAPATRPEGAVAWHRMRHDFARIKRPGSAMAYCSFAGRSVIFDAVLRPKVHWISNVSAPQGLGLGSVNWAYLASLKLREFFGATNCCSTSTDHVWDPLGLRFDFQLEERGVDVSELELDSLDMAGPAAEIEAIARAKAAHKHWQLLF